MAKKDFSFPTRAGKHSSQAHVGLPDGSYEEELGRYGFFGPATHIYHANAPTDWVNIEGDCKPRALDLNKAEVGGVHNRQLVLNNRNCEVYVLRNPHGQDACYYRNADGDEVHFVHQGSGVLETDLGAIEYKAGDYLYIPRTMTYRFMGKDEQFRLIIQNTNALYGQPDRGILGHHALYDPAVLRLPKLEALEVPKPTEPNGQWKIAIKRAGRWTGLYHKRPPIDTIGYKGDHLPFALDIKDIRPVMSHRAHLAPSVHTTFVGEGFVICSFVPRPLEEDKTCLKVPFYHRNVEYDEVLFYHAGDFFSRDSIKPGWMTFHPTGIHHGPHPKALKNQHSKERTDEYAVMIDTRQYLEVDQDAADACEWKDYWKSWMEG